MSKVHDFNAGPYFLFPDILFPLFKAFTADSVSVIVDTTFGMQETVYANTQHSQSPENNHQLFPLFKAFTADSVSVIVDTTFGMQETVYANSQHPSPHKIITYCFHCAKHSQLIRCHLLLTPHLSSKTQLTQTPSIPVPTKQSPTVSTVQSIHS